jgi:hypothetical protein
MMLFRVKKNGKPYAFEDGRELLERSDVYAMDVDIFTAGRILQAMESIEYYGSAACEWEYEGDGYKVEGVRE